MSTRSYIAKQIGNNRYQTIYCHSDGDLTYNGAMLLENYNTPETVERLIALGNISCLNIQLDPDPDKPHSFDYDERQENVTVAYARDRGDKNAQSKTMTLAQLDDPNSWTEYVYIYTQDNEWKYFKSGQSEQGLRDVRDDLIKAYERNGLTYTQGYYGILTESTVKYLKHVRDIEPEENGINELSL